MQQECREKVGRSLDSAEEEGRGAVFSVWSNLLIWRRVDARGVGRFVCQCATSSWWKVFLQLVPTLEPIDGHFWSRCCSNNTAHPAGCCGTPVTREVGTESMTTCVAFARLIVVLGSFPRCPSAAFYHPPSQHAWIWEHSLVVLGASTKQVIDIAKQSVPDILTSKWILRCHNLLCFFFEEAVKPS